MNPTDNQPIAQSTEATPENETDPIVFLAKQILEIKTDLEKQIQDLKKEVESSNKNSEASHSDRKKDMEEIKTMIKSVLNE